MADPVPSLNSLLPKGLKLVGYLPGKQGEPAKFFDVRSDDGAMDSPDKDWPDLLARYYAIAYAVDPGTPPYGENWPNYAKVYTDLLKGIVSSNLPIDGPTPPLGELWFSFADRFRALLNNTAKPNVNLNGLGTPPLDKSWTDFASVYLSKLR